MANRPGVATLAGGRPGVFPSRGGTLCLGARGLSPGHAGLAGGGRVSRAESARYVSGPPRGDRSGPSHCALTWEGGRMVLGRADGDEVGDESSAAAEG